MGTRRLLRSLWWLAAAVTGVALFAAAAGVPAPALDAMAAGCPKETDAAVIGGKRVCLKVGIRCEQKHQAQYVRRGYSCSARGRIGLLVCTGASYYAVIGGVHGCLRAGQACQAKYQAQYRKLGFECERARLIRPKPINP